MRESTLSTAARTPLADYAITEAEYQRFCALLYENAGIALGANKQTLLVGRLQRRLASLGLAHFSGYLRYIQQPEHDEELNLAIDLLTTNETYFWREADHFRQLTELARQAAQQRCDEFRVWSAASSSGEEPYTIAMVLQSLNDSGVRLRWEVVASDISQRMLTRARRAHYSDDRAQQLPRALLHRYCLKGTGEQAGTLLVQRELRQRVRFELINLIEPLPDIGRFDAIFLRNVMIYFDGPTKRKVVTAVARSLKPDGVLFVGLAESLNGVTDQLACVAPGMYRARTPNGQPR